MTKLPWPPVVTLDTPLAVHLCPHVGRGLLVVTPEATQADFDETLDVLNAIEWTITDSVVGVNAAGCEVVEVSGDPSDLPTMEALQGADDQLLDLAGLVPVAE